MLPRGGAGVIPAPPRIWWPCGRGGAGRAARSSHAMLSNGLGSQIDRQREARPHPCQTQTKRSGEFANQARKMRRSLRKTFPKKVIDGLLKLPYTDKCRWQAFPPREGHSTPLSLLLTRRQGSSRLAPPYQQADEGSIPPPLHPRRPRFPFRVFPANPQAA